MSSTLECHYIVYWVILGLYRGIYRGDGKENGNHYIVYWGV